MASYIDPITGAVITIPNGSGGSSGGSNNNTSSSNKGSSSSTSKDATAQTSTGSATKVANDIYEYMEGSVEVVPNPDFRCRQVYGIEGVGYIFKGAYYFKKVRHSIGATYKVDADVVRMEGIQINSNSNIDRDRAPSGSSNPPAPPKPPTTTRYHTIVRGDCLWDISRRYYGDGSKYMTIYNANKSKCPNPNLIFPGDVLVIP